MRRLPIRGMPFVRMTQLSKYSPRASTYFKWKYDIQLLSRGYSPKGILNVQFIMRIPKSKGRDIGAPHTIKPDLDNLLKALIDALLPAGDEHLHRINASKIWGPKDEIVLYGD